MKKKRKKNRIVIALPDMNRHTICEVHNILESIVRSYEKLYCDQIQQHYEDHCRRSPMGLWGPADAETEIPF